MSETKKKVKKAATFSTERSKPNILVSGTPGVGKTTMCKKLCQSVKILKLINIGDFAKEHGCLDEWDDELQCHELNEDKVVDELEDIMTEGGVVVDHHATDFFPERWFDIVFVLRTDNTILYDRLTSRGYEGKKLENNIDCEIFQTILDESKESYKEEIVHELSSNNDSDIDSNVQRIVAWLDQWQKDNVS
jgi:adenylate kinase